MGSALGRPGVRAGGGRASLANLGVLAESHTSTCRPRQLSGCGVVSEEIEEYKMASEEWRRDMAATYVRFAPGRLALAQDPALP